MNIEDFDFELPEDLIAQTPLKNRSASRLMVLDKATRELDHKHSTEIEDYLKSGDCVVLNETKVHAARVYGVKEETGGKVEVLLLKQKEGDTWEVLAKPAKRIKVGTKLL